MQAVVDSGASHRDFMQAVIVDRRPDSGRATGLRGEDVDLIGVQAHVALLTLGGIGRLNVSRAGGFYGYFIPPKLIEQIAGHGHHLFNAPAG